MRCDLHSHLPRRRDASLWQYRKYASSHTYNLEAVPADTHTTPLKPPLNIKNKGEWIGIERLRWAKRFNIPICETVPEPFPQLTLNAMRALCVVTLAHPDRLDDCFTAMYQAFWVDRRSISKPEVWGAVLTEVFGESEGRKIAEMAGGAEAKKLLARNTDLAVAEGAFGLPYFVATNAEGFKEAFWGFDHLGQVVDHLQLQRQDQGFRVML
ncbi:hypothetical protein LTR53_003624 [Teratosphaeriaceae sp. CCFEE 6253]|nr:hypothetical protein LTR53_003624 [Teratosphaeriaceae sp. CCFEE 6253]